jgi:hypothetical protein
VDRREMLAAIGLATAGVALGTGGRAPAAGTPPPTGGRRVYDARAFGAAGDGVALDSPAVNRAVDAAAAAGGGMAYVPPGVYRVGTVVLKSNVTLYLEAGATLLGSADVADYTPQPGPPRNGDANPRHLIFARDAENVTLAGPGRIDGQGPTFWYPSGREQPADRWGDVATFDTKVRTRPSPMLEFHNVTNLRIEDVRIENSPGWTLRPMACANVFIRGITIRNPIQGLNVDGIDLTCCRDVSISDCHIATADDAICLKSEDMYGNAIGVSRNITIANCTLSGCCNGLKFGTSTYGGFENVTLSNCVISNGDVPINQRVIAGIAIEMVDGGYVDGVTISNVRMQRVRSPIFIRLGARHAATTSRPAVDVGRGRSFIRGVSIDGLHATGSIMTGSVTGQPGNPVEDVSISNLRVDTDESALFGPAAAAAAVGRPVPEVPELPRAYPEARMFGHLPAHGLYARHVAGLRLRGVEFRAPPAEVRPAVVAEDVDGLDVDGLRSTALTGGAAPVRLVDCRRAFVRGAVAAPGSRALVAVEGSRTERVSIAGCDLVDARRPFEAAHDVPAGSVRAAGNVTLG